MNNPGSTSAKNGLGWNLLSILVGMASLVAILFFAVIIINPFSPLNPFPPVPLPTLMVLPTATITPLPLPSTFTPTQTLFPSATQPKAPTWTPLPSNTPFTIGSVTPRSALASSTPLPSGFAFDASVTQVSSSYYHPDAGCNWMGVAGQAVDMNNSPILYLTIHISGTLGGKIVDYYSLTGTAPNYGQAGFEFVLGDKAIASSNSLWVQLLDQSNLSLSKQVKLTTSSDCDKNLVMIRFKKVQ